MTTETSYSHEDVRRMIEWDLRKSRYGTALSMREVNKLVEALSDEVLTMLEKINFLNLTEIEKRIENHRAQ